MGSLVSFNSDPQKRLQRKGRGSPGMVVWVEFNRERQETAELRRALMGLISGNSSEGTTEYVCVWGEGGDYASSIKSSSAYMHCHN